MLKGKQGGSGRTARKRVDYSAVRIIVVGPELATASVAVCQGMAVELFKPFIIHKLVEKGIAETVKRAKKIGGEGVPEVTRSSRRSSRTIRYCWNRAPTLPPAGHPGVRARDSWRVRRSGFTRSSARRSNADFDGDQMAVHRAALVRGAVECRLLMISSNNILKTVRRPAGGGASQDSAGGAHFPTKEPADFEEQLKTAPRIASMAELEMGLAVKALESIAGADVA